MKKFLFLVLLAGVCAAYAGYSLQVRAGSSTSRHAGGTTSAAAIKLVILQTNDSHGQCLSYKVGQQRFGGYARLSTLVNRIRSANPEGQVLLLDCGDIISRGDELTQRTKGGANFALMNYLKYDAFVPGNGEFYDGIKNLQARIAEANFPVLAANVTVGSPLQPLARPYTLCRMGSVKVGIIGLCGGGIEPAPGLKVEDHATVARKLVPELRKQCDIVVAMTHVGVFSDVFLASSINGIDVILGAHTHTVLPEGMTVRNPEGKNVLICQTGEKFRYLGRVDLTLEPRDGRYEVVESQAKLIPLDEKVPEDPAVLELIGPMERKVGMKPTLEE